MCNENVFPFNHILNKIEFLSTLLANGLHHSNLNSISILLCVPFEFNKDKTLLGLSITQILLLMVLLITIQIIAFEKYLKEMNSNRKGFLD